ncbi:MAG: Na+/H+ antiporter NhaC family protein [Alphaproteobacteria bacterium]|nr:Na+/H+ antiporter NhaC family protein [Alphaproteobacteria bacterium]NCQ67014.1 Na+/H+ antiporter NhaC family protein [Alphaproteobacteria bacterium]NCT07611.1 Na+/H+ antiporter NhaC family protein [Alphaproteobacteria bacterium]
MPDKPYSAPPHDKANPLALLPLLLFLAIFVGSGVYFSLQGIPNAFYQISPNVAILPAITLALILGSGKLSARMDSFLEGVRDPNIIIMCLIYLLAGAFATATQGIGSIDATVNWGLSILPTSFLLPGLFIIAAFMATAMGTSMGVIATVAPLALGLSSQTGLNCSWCMGAVVSGAMFGDNLSLISDTTIASVNTQGAKFKEKFILNATFAIPAMIITILIFYMVSTPAGDFEIAAYDGVKIIPYLVILALALAGLNVLVVLIIGIVVAGFVGFATTDTYSLVIFSKHIAGGFASMQEILILSLLVGGLSYLTNKQGGLEFLIHHIEKIALKLRHKKESPRIGEMSISAISSLADICTANNTVAIILSGGIAKKLAKKHGVSPERSACLIDIFTCAFQGLLPYSAQLLLASSISGLSPLAIMTHVIYSPLLAFVTVLGIIFKWPQFKTK